MSITNKKRPITMGTLLRTVMQILAYLNQIIAVVGSTTFASASWYQWVSVAVTILITIVSYWYNNDWTNLAKTTNDIFNLVKDGKISRDELESFIKKHEREE